MTAKGRVNASTLTNGYVIRVERIESGDDAGKLAPTTRRTGGVVATVTGKTTVPAGPYERNCRYVIHTDQGDTRPAAGIQTFTLVSEPGVPAGDQVATVPAGWRDPWNFATDSSACQYYESAREYVLDGDQPAPERSDTRPRIEIFRGRKLRVERNSGEWGTLRTLVNGQLVGTPYGRESDDMNRAAAQLRRDVVAADERRVTEPGAYPAHWFRGAVDLPPVMVAYAKYQAEREAAERVAYDAATCRDTSHAPGVLACVAAMVRCNGVPADADQLTTTEISAATMIGFLQVGRELRDKVAERLPDVGPVSFGESDPYGRKQVRDFQTFQMTAGRHLVTVVWYQGRHPLSGTDSYVAVLVDGQPVDGASAVNAAQPAGELTRFLSWSIAEAVRNLDTEPSGDQVPADDVATFYVHRAGTRTDPVTEQAIRTEGWVGPIEGAQQAEREAAAWASTGQAVIVHPDSESTRAMVAAWEDKTVDGWEHSTDPSQRRRWQEREDQRRELARELADQAEQEAARRATLAEITRRTMDDDPRAALAGWTPTVPAVDQVDPSRIMPPDAPTGSFHYVYQRESGPIVVAKWIDRGRAMEQFGNETPFVRCRPSDLVKAAAEIGQRTIDDQHAWALRIDAAERAERLTAAQLAATANAEAAARATGETDRGKIVAAGARAAGRVWAEHHARTWGHLTQGAAQAPEATDDSADQVDPIKGDRVTFVSRGVAMSGTVVRVKRDGMITVDVPDTADRAGGWWDVRPDQITRDGEDVATGPHAPDTAGPTDTVPDDKPAGRSFRTWEELATWIRDGRPALVEQATTEQAPEVPASLPAGEPAGLVWRGGPSTEFTCDGCGKRTIDPCGGSMQTTDGKIVNCRDCCAERTAQHWDQQPSGVYGFAVNGEYAGAARHTQQQPHPFVASLADESRCADPYASGYCGRFEDAPIHQHGGTGGAGPAPAGPDTVPAGPSDQVDQVGTVPATVEVGELPARWVARGTTDDVTDCEHCGKPELKSTVRLVALNTDGEETGEMYVGSDCAARLSGRPAQDIRTEAARADRAAVDAARAVHRAWSDARSDHFCTLRDAALGKGARPATILEWARTEPSRTAVAAWDAEHPPPPSVESRDGRDRIVPSEPIQHDPAPAEKPADTPADAVPDQLPAAGSAGDDLDPVRAVLSRSTLDGYTLAIPSEQLPRPVWVALHATMQGMGATGGSRKGQPYRFERDPGAVLAAFITGGPAPMHERKAAGWVRTPDTLAADVVARFAQLDRLPRPLRVLEPSAGDGALIVPVVAAVQGASVTAVEPVDARAFQLGKIGVYPVHVCTFEQFTEKHSDQRYHLVIMNPPYSVPGNRTIWADHVRTAWDLVAEGGRLVAILPASYMNGTTKKVEQLRTLLTGATVEALPAGSFKQSGTDVNTCVVAVTKDSRPAAPADPVEAARARHAKSIVRKPDSEPVRVDLPKLTHADATARPVQMFNGWGGETLVQYVGDCIRCGRPTWSDGACDPRGALGMSAVSTLVAEEYEQAGPDVCMCWQCADDSVTYHRAGELAKQLWTAPPTAGATAEPAPADEVPPAVELACRLTGMDVERRLALDLIWELSAESGEVRYERLSLTEAMTTELADLVAVLPLDEVRRVLTRLRLAKDRAKGYTWRGDEIPFRPLPELGEPVPGTPVHVWQHGDERNEIVAVSVVPRTLYEIGGTRGYETMRPECGPQIIARSSAAGREPAYRVFWQLSDGSGWHSATDDMTGAEFASWNGWRALDQTKTPTREVDEWLARVLAATGEDAAWDAAAPAEPAPTREPADQDGDQRDAGTAGPRIMTIRHRAEDGTTIDGLTYPEGVAAGVGRHNSAAGYHALNWRHSREVGGWYERGSRDKRHNAARVDALAARLELSGYAVARDIDDTLRPTAEVEADRRERAEDRAAGLSLAAGRHGASAAARLDAVRAGRGWEPGQPVIGPRDAARRRKLAERQDSAHRQADHAGSLAERAAATAAHAERRDRSDVIARRIERLEEDQRRAERNEQTTRVGDLAEQVTHWRGVLEERAAAGEWAEWEPRHFTPCNRETWDGGDWVFIGVSWYPVLKVNRKSVTTPPIIYGGSRLNAVGQPWSWTDTQPLNKIKARRRDGVITRHGGAADQQDNESAAT